MKKILLVLVFLCAIMHTSVYAGELTQADIDKLNEEKRIAAQAEIERVQNAAREKAENEMAAAQATAAAHAEDVQRRIEAYEEWVDEQEELVYGEAMAVESDSIVDEYVTNASEEAAFDEEVDLDNIIDDNAIAEVVLDAQVSDATNVTDAVVVESDINEYGVSSADYDNLCKIVEAEGANSGLDGKQMIANVILNRVNSPEFDNTITGVIKAYGQFGPAMSGKMHKVFVTNETIEAVNRALSGENKAGAALYFQSAKRGSKFLGKTAVASVGGNNFYN